MLATFRLWFHLQSSYIRYVGFSHYGNGGWWGGDCTTRRSIVVFDWMRNTQYFFVTEPTQQGWHTSKFRNLTVLKWCINYQFYRDARAEAPFTHIRRSVKLLAFMNCQLGRERRVKPLMCETNTADCKEIIRYGLRWPGKRGENSQAAHQWGCEGLTENE